MKRKEAGHYKVLPNAAQNFDDTAMYADFIASTPTVDREDEVIFPEDFNVSEWRSNPVWLWAHDKSAPPIGAGYRGDGSPAIDQSPERLILGCKFSQANPQGALTYALYKEGTLKMVSVGFINTETKQMAGKAFGHPRPVTRIMDPELVECSCVPIGMNRSAMLLSIKGKSWDGYVDRVGLASVLSKGHIHGEKVTDSMRRDLEPFAESAGKFKLFGPRMPIAKGWTIAVPDNKIPKFSSQRPAKGLALASDKGTVSVASIAPKAPLKAGTIPATTKEVTQAPNEVPVQEVVLSVGAQTYKAMMDAALGISKGGMEMIGQSDNPEIKASVQKLASYFAAGVKMAHADAIKYFPDNQDVFTEPATLAAQYEMLEAEPDAAMANTDAEADMADDIKAEDGPADDEAKPEKDDAETGSDTADDDTEDEKGLTAPVTREEFAAWYGKAFGELSPQEAIEAAMKPLLDKIAGLEAQLAEHHEALEITEQVLTQGR